MTDKVALAFNLDQHQKYSQYDAEWFKWNLGRLPEMIAYSLAQPVPLADSMLKAYQFGGDPLTGGTLLADGVYSFPDDPLLYPFARCSTDRGEFFMYPYGIVAICEEGKADVLYRFD